jgi:hypothetical protein
MHNDIYNICIVKGLTLSTRSGPCTRKRKTLRTFLISLPKYLSIPYGALVEQAASHLVRCGQATTFGDWGGWVNSSLFLLS